MMLKYLSSYSYLMHSQAALKEGCINLPSRHFPSYFFLIVLLDLHTAISSKHLLGYVFSSVPQTGR